MEHIAGEYKNYLQKFVFRDLTFKMVHYWQS